MAKVVFCNACAQAAPLGTRFCSNCGQPLHGTPAPAAAQPQQPAQQAAAAQPQASLQTCPGCRTTTGPEGALCPKCGSRYPEPGARQGLLVALPVMAGVFGLGFLISDVNKLVGELISLAGAIGFIGVIVAFFGSWGRVGPARATSTSCCCVVTLLVLPALAIAFTVAAGPALAPLALVAWGPTVRLLDAGTAR